jgi:hypothetical protein
MKAAKPRFPSTKPGRRTISMTPQTYETIRAAALAQGIPMSQVIEDMVVRFTEPRLAIVADQGAPS